jgi:hypothetical protein
VGCESIFIKTNFMIDLELNGKYNISEEKKITLSIGMINAFMIKICSLNT